MVFAPVNWSLSPFAFKTQSEWEKARRRSFDRFKDGFETYQGEIVKSHGEKAIANWLYSQGVPYQYERNYEHDTANEHHRQYKQGEQCRTDNLVYFTHCRKLVFNLQRYVFSRNYTPSRATVNTYKL